MDFQGLLQQEASTRGLTMVPLSSVVAMPSSRKVACCGGFVEKVVAESERDCTVLLRDATGGVHCAIHGAVSDRYPDVLATGAVLLLQDVTALIVPSLLPPIIVVCLEHLVALLLPEGPPLSNAEYTLDSTAPGEESPTLGHFTSTNDVVQTPGRLSGAAEGALPQVAPSNISGLPTKAEEAADVVSVDHASDDDSLQLADDL